MLPTEVEEIDSAVSPNHGVQGSVFQSMGRGQLVSLETFLVGRQTNKFVFKFVIASKNFPKDTFSLQKLIFNGIVIIS